MPYPTVVTGGAVIAMYSWLFGLAVVDAERRRVAKAKDGADADLLKIALKGSPSDQSQDISED